MFHADLPESELLATKELLHNKEAALAEKEGKIKKVKEMLTTKQEELQRCIARAATIEQENKELKAIIKSRDEKIIHLQTLVNRKQNEIVNLEDKNKSMKRQCESGNDVQGNSHSCSYM